MAGTEDSLPWMKFYPADFMGSGKVQMMSPAERGIYISLLCHEWQEGHLPDEPKRLARVAGATPEEMDAAWPAVRPCFNVAADGKLYHERLEAERRDAAERRERRRKMSEAGRKGAAKRWADRDPNNPPRGGGNDDGYTTRASRATDAQILRDPDDPETTTCDESHGASAAGDDSREALLEAGKGAIAARFLPTIREKLRLGQPASRDAEKRDVSVLAQWLEKGWDPWEVDAIIDGFCWERDHGRLAGWIEPRESAGMVAMNRKLEGRANPREEWKTIGLKRSGTNGASPEKRKRTSKLEPVRAPQLAREGEAVS